VRIGQMADSLASQLADLAVGQVVNGRGLERCTHSLS
jgi:hypothetical protein